MNVGSDLRVRYWFTKKAAGEIKYLKLLEKPG
jgi:hypothetical protein